MMLGGINEYLSIKALSDLKSPLLMVAMGLLEQRLNVHALVPKIELG